LILLYNDFMDL